MNEDELKPSTEAEPQNLSTEHGRHGTDARPADHLDKDRVSTETIPRKSSLT